MRVVVDTNVLVSSFFGGYPRNVIDNWKTGKIILCLTNPIIDEYVDVLQRLGLSDTKEIHELLTIFKKQVHCLYTAKTPSLKVCVDPDDDKFIEAAVAMDAKIVISGDKHLKVLKRYADILILSPKDFIDSVEK
jgi:putative PIN family toxin of toxin-antitoxin system